MTPQTALGSCLLGASLLFGACARDRRGPDGDLDLQETGLELDVASLAEPQSSLRPRELRGDVPTAARIADYVIQARLDADGHRIDGTSRITWRNTANESVSTLPLHLYMNAFRANDTAWMRGSPNAHGETSSARQSWGSIELHAVDRVHRGPTRDFKPLAIAAPSTEPTALAWREESDPSIATIELLTPLPAGHEITIEIVFVTQLPKVIARTGYSGGFHLAGQWFPKLAVLDPGERPGDSPRWNNHVFTFNSEFYADFGNYLVELDVPATMTVGATGIRVDAQQSEGRKRLTYRAQMVHDFAWAADPLFVEHRGRYKDIRIRQLMQPDRVMDAPRHLAAQVATLKSMEARFGPYPWSTITIIHPPDDAMQAAGMEYPTFFTTSDIWHSGFPRWILEERLSGVYTTVHEFGHQYFQGIFASNENAQPWLDEGLNETANAIAYMDRYAPDERTPPWLVRVLGHELTAADLIRIANIEGDLLDPIDGPAEQFDQDVQSYGSVVYRKTAAVMHTLRNIVGHVAWDRALRLYAQQARFTHPHGSSLEKVLIQQLGGGSGQVDLGTTDLAPVRLDVKDFLDQGLREITEVDFSLYAVENRRLRNDNGLHRLQPDIFAIGPRTELSRTKAPEHIETPLEELEDSRVEAIVVIHRIGGYRVPVELSVTFADGSHERRYWSGESRHHSFSWPGRRIVHATIDPDHLLWLEGRRLNNFRYAKKFESPTPGLDRIVSLWSEATTLAALGFFGP